MGKSSIKGMRKDLTNTLSSFWLWCVPSVLALSGVLLYSNGILSLTLAGMVYTASVAWIGIGCFINGRRCGRVHCKIDGVLFPLLSVIGVLNVLKLIHLGWNVYWLAFFIILLASFSAELLWKKYI